MKKIGLICVSSVLICGSAFAVNSINLLTTTNGVLLAPTNFFRANSNLLNAAIAPGGSAVSTNGLASTNYVATATNNLSTNLLAVTAASSNAIWSAHNALSNFQFTVNGWTSNRFTIQDATNTVLQTAISGKVSTNDTRYLAALTNAAAFDAAGAAAQVKSDLASSNYVNAATWGATNTALQTQLDHKLTNNPARIDFTNGTSITANAGGVNVRDTNGNAALSVQPNNTDVTHVDSSTGDYAKVSVRTNAIEFNWNGMQYGGFGANGFYGDGLGLTNLNYINATNGVAYGTFNFFDSANNQVGFIAADDAVPTMALGIPVVINNLAGWLPADANEKFAVFGNAQITGTNSAGYFQGIGSAVSNLNASLVSSGTLPNARLGATVVTNVAQTTNSAGVASIANNVLSIGTNVPASSSGGLTNGQNSVTLGSISLTNTLTMGRTNDGQNGVYLAKIQSSNSPATFNWTMASTPYSATNVPDQVMYWGWNAQPGGGVEVAGEAGCYLGIEREWFGQYEHYMNFYTVSGVGYRPFFYGLDRTNGTAQFIAKGDTWQWLTLPSHTTQLMYLSTNQLEVDTGVGINPGTKKALSISDNVGAERLYVTNGILSYRGINFNPDVSGLAMSTDSSNTNNVGVGIQAGYFQTRAPGSPVITNTYGRTGSGYGASGVFAWTNSWQADVQTDNSGIAVNNTSGTMATTFSMGNGGVLNRTVISCVGSSDNTGLAGGGASQYDTIIKSKLKIIMTTCDSNQRDMTVSNRWVQVGGALDVTRSVTVATNATARQLALTGQSAGPTFAQWGGATNSGFFWSSNSTPPTLYWSYFDGSSNRVDTAK